MERNRCSYAFAVFLAKILMIMHEKHDINLYDSYDMNSFTFKYKSILS